MTVRLPSASWAQKRLIPTFEIWCTSGSWKIFFSPIRASRSLLDLFRPPAPKNVWFMKNFLLAVWREQMAVGLISASWAQKRFTRTFQTWCTSISWKIFFSAIPASRCLLDSFRPPESKNVWFLLSRHDVLPVHEKFSSRRFRRADAC